MRFGVLGPLAVWSGAGAAVPVPGFKVRALLADLLLHAGRQVAAGQLIEDLWGAALPANPEATLQSKVSQLRRVLDDAEPGGRDLVGYRSGGYVLHVEEDATDRGRFQTLTADARAALGDEPQRAVALLDEALALWRGPPLAEFAAYDFARPAIVELTEARLAATEDRISAQLALGQHAALVGELDGLVHEHPLRERLRGLHMRALYQAGRQADALDSFQQQRAQLVEELGIDPGAELRALHAAILAQDPSLDAAAAPTRSGRPRTNLPAPRSTLVGRDAAVQRLRGLLDDGRLVTLTGTGGVGKTRLALATARAVLDAYPDGVWVVELTAHEEHAAAATVAEQLAAVLGVGDDETPVAGEELGTRIAAALRHQRLLLVLDNCDHLVEALAPLVAQLLDTAAEVRILATSRRPLGIAGEQLWSVPPLAVPAEAVDEPERLRRFEAIELFAERAAAADPDFALTADNAATVTEICRRLDGLPLALELAAARVRALPVEALAARLDDRFRLLSAGTADTPRRQQTLWALIDWSWELLDDAERAVLRRLSVFAGGATLAAAEAACAGDVLAADDVLDVVVRLVDHSLVVVDDAPGGARYRLLETIRSYGLHRLAEAGEVDARRQHHAAFYAALAETGAAQLRGPDQRAWLERFDVEAADLRAAVEWAVNGDAALALRVATAMTWFWYLRGRQDEASRLLRRALDAAGEDAPAAARAKALTWLGGLGALEHSVSDPAAHRRAALAAYAELDDAAGLAHAKLLLGGLLRPWEIPDGGALNAEALEAFRGAGERWEVAAALSVRGWLALGHGDVDAARRDGEEARAVFQETGDRWGQVRAAELLGRVAEVRGDHAQATDLHRDALEAAEALGLWATVAQALSRLGRLAALAGDDAEAIALHERALRLTRELSLGQGIVFARVGLGLVLRRQGRLDDAETHFRAVLDWHRERGFHSGTAFCLAELGFIADLRGDPAHARTLHLQGLEAAGASGDPRAVALALEGLAGAVVADDAATAATLLGAATTLREAAGGPLPAAERGDVDRIAAAAAATLGDDGYATAVDTGAGLEAQAATRLARRAAAPGTATHGDR